MKTSNTKRLVGIAMFGAIAYVLMFFAFPILPIASFMKVDFSDIPILLGMFLYGPVGGVLIALVRTVLHYLQTSGDMGYPIGDIASFIASIVYSYPIYFIMSKHMKKGTLTMSNTLVANVTGVISLATIMSLANWLIITPLYLAVMGFSVGPIKEFVLLGVLPFNIIKGLLVSSVFIFMFTKLQPWIIKNQATHINE